jgi:hypothetical protein
VQNGSVFPVDFTFSPNGGDLAVGGTITLAITLHYSDGSTYTMPAGSGSGTAWLGTLASSNPKVATVTPGTFVVTGVSPGECIVSLRSPTGTGTTPGPGPSRRVSCAIFVHN